MNVTSIAPPCERFKEVADFVGYGVGADGSTWTRKLHGSIHGALKTNWSPLSQHRRKDGHLQVNLTRPGKRTYPYVHQLVLEAFVGPCPEGMECLHRDGNPANNRLENLRWGSHAENMEDMANHGAAYRPIGSLHWIAILTEADIPEIFRMKDQGISHARIALRFGVAKPTITSVLRRHSWKHVALERSYLRENR